MPMCQWRNQTFTDAWAKGRQATYTCSTHTHAYLHMDTNANTASSCALILDQNDIWINTWDAYNPSSDAGFKLSNKLQTQNGQILTKNKYSIPWSIHSSQASIQLWV